MQFDGFDWDDGNWPKCGKHGVTKEEIEAAFTKPGVLVMVDENHGGGEDRFLLIAMGAGVHHGLFIGFTLRMHDDRKLVRPVTARYMHKKEADSYER